MSAWIGIGIALAVLLLVAIAAAVYLVGAFSTPIATKGMAVDWMKANRNRTLAIDGPIELSVFPRVAVKLSRLNLSEAGRSEQFAAIDSAALAVDVMPLLSGRVVVGHVEADEACVLNCCAMPRAGATPTTWPAPPRRPRRRRKPSRSPPPASHWTSTSTASPSRTCVPA